MILDWLKWYAKRPGTARLYIPIQPHWRNSPGMGEQKTFSIYRRGMNYSGSDLLKSAHEHMHLWAHTDTLICLAFGIHATLCWNRISILNKPYLNACVYIFNGFSGVVCKWMHNPQMLRMRWAKIRACLIGLCGRIATYPYIDLLMCIWSTTKPFIGTFTWQHAIMNWHRS